MLTQLQSTDEFESAISQPRVLVEFFATWCHYCQGMMPVVEEFAQEEPEVAVVQVDVDKFPELVEAYGVESWPNFFYFENGQMVNHEIGTQSLSELKEMTR